MATTRKVNFVALAKARRGVTGRPKGVTDMGTRKLPPDTYSDQEMMSPEFRAAVGRTKRAIRDAILAGPNIDMGVFWAALHEFAYDALKADKGEEQAEAYWSKLMEFASWQFAREGFPLDEEQS
jgi:hypothetical protein